MSHTSGARQMVLPSCVRLRPFRLSADLPAVPLHVSARRATMHGQGSTHAQKPHLRH